MLITISTPEYNVEGFVALTVSDDSDLGQTARRMNRVATLDGNAAVNDFGHSYADRTMTLTWSPQAYESEQAIAALIRSQARLNASTPDGVFETAPESYQYTPDESRLVLLVLSKISE